MASRLRKLFEQMRGDKEHYLGSSKGRIINPLYYLCIIRLRIAIIIV